MKKSESKKREFLALPMKKRKKKSLLLEILLMPFLAILFFVGFGAGFIFAGYQTIHVTSTKNHDGRVVFDYTQEFFWGFLEFPQHIEDVKFAEISSVSYGSGRKRRHLSTIVLASDSEKKALIGGFSNLDSKIKNRMLDKINSYVKQPDEKSYSDTIRIRNAFYWIGLPFFAIGIIGLIGWPSCIIRSLRKYREADS